MTLLESLIATVLLAVVAVACLEGTRRASALQQRSRDVSSALSIAESELSRAVLGLPTAHGVQVTRVPYTAVSPRLELVEVEVPLESGGSTRLSRIVERPLVVLP